MKAVWKNKVIAESKKEDLIYIEGNWYFPKSSIHKEYFKENDHRTTCHWKGEASYYDVLVDGDKNESAAFYYPEPIDSSIDKVKKNYKNYVSFWRGIQVTE